MVQTVQPYVYVEPPAIDERILGLFSVTRDIPGVDEHWQYGGIEYEGLGCFSTSYYPIGINEAGGAGGSKTLSNGVPTTKAIPFGVYGGIQCGSIGQVEQRFADRARTIVELNGQRAAEHALWTGAGGNSPALNGAVDSGHVSVVGVATDLVSAVRQLEDWLGDTYSGRGTIHAKRGISALAGSKQLVRGDYDLNPNTVSTPGGTRWSFGAGYDGTGPGATAPATGTQWIYATGQVNMLRSEIFEPATPWEALDRTHNLVNVYAEQIYLLSYDCIVGAALVDLTK